MRRIFERIKGNFAGHSGATFKKFPEDNRKNTPCPKGAVKIFYYCVKFLGNIPDIPCEICLVLENFISHSLHKINVNRT